MRMDKGVLFFLLTATLAAGDPALPPPGWIQAKAALVKPDTCNCIKDLTEVGLGAGMWFTPRWAAELDYLQGTLKSQRTTARSDEKLVMGSLLFGLNPDGRMWFPYLRAGLGGAEIGSPYSLGPVTRTRLAFLGGVGVQGALGDHVITSLEVRATTIETQVSRTEKAAILGLGVRWGERAPVAAQAPFPAPAPAPVPAPEPAPKPAPAAPPPVVAPPAPAPAPVVIPPPPEPVPPPKPPTRIVLDDATLHFANSKAELTPKGEAAIRQVAESLKAYAGTYTLVVTGHTSSVGSRAFNMVLSRKRAEAVAAILVKAGLPAGRVRSLGLGPDQPLAENGTPEGQARNRRVEIEVKATGVEVRHSVVK